MTGEIAGSGMGVSFDLSGTVAIVTGSTRRIGRAIAEALVAHGAQVAISSRKQEVCDEVSAEINASFPSATIGVSANLSDKESLQLLVEKTRSRLGPIDTLVCNAASNPHYGSLATISDEQFGTIFRNNIIANNWLAQLVAPEMTEPGVRIHHPCLFHYWPGRQQSYWGLCRIKGSQHANGEESCS